MEEEYLGELKKYYVGYSDKTTNSLLTDLKTTWCKITTLEKGKALGVFRAPWDMTSNTTTYKRHLDKAQLKCADMDVKATKSKKVQIYVQQIYGADIFTKKEFIKWEGKKEEDKTWATAKTFFGTLYKASRSYESDMKAYRSIFETANSFTQNPRNDSERSMAERSTGTAATNATTKTPTNQWVEYSDSLEDSLLKANDMHPPSHQEQRRTKRAS